MSVIPFTLTVAVTLHVLEKDTRCCQKVKIGWVAGTVTVCEILAPKSDEAKADQRPLCGPTSEREAFTNTHGSRSVSNPPLGSGIGGTGVRVAVGLAVFVGVVVRVGVSVGVAVAVEVGLGVCVGVFSGVGLGPLVGVVAGSTASGI